MSRSQNSVKYSSLAGDSLATAFSDDIPGLMSASLSVVTVFDADGRDSEHSVVTRGRCHSMSLLIGQS